MQIKNDLDQFGAEITLRKTKRTSPVME